MNTVNPDGMPEDKVSHDKRVLPGPIARSVTKRAGYPRAVIASDNYIFKVGQTKKNRNEAVFMKKRKNIIFILISLFFSSLFLILFEKSMVQIEYQFYGEQYNRPTSPTARSALAGTSTGNMTPSCSGTTGGSSDRTVSSGSTKKTAERRCSCPTRFAA